MMVEDPTSMGMGRFISVDVKWVLFDGTPSSGGMTNTKGLLEEIDKVLTSESRPMQHS